MEEEKEEKEGKEEEEKKEKEKGIKEEVSLSPVSSLVVHCAELCAEK